MGQSSLERMFFKRLLAMVPQVLSGEFEKQQCHLQRLHLEHGPELNSSLLFIAYIVFGIEKIATECINTFDFQTCLCSSDYEYSDYSQFHENLSLTESISNTVLSATHRLQCAFKDK